MQQRTLLGYALGLSMLSSAAFAAPELAPIKIGIIAPVTGKSSEDMGKSIVGGAKVFAADLNQMGGIMGRKIELVIRDDQAKADVGVAMSKDLVSKEKVVAVVGFGNTGVALPSAKVMQEAKVPLIISGATGATLTSSFMPPAYPANYIFRTAASDALQAVVILNDIIDRRKIDKIAFLHDDSPFGMFGQQTVLAEMAKRKIKLSSVESFKVGDSDMTAQLQRAKESGAQAVVIYSLYVDAATVVKGAGKIHFRVPMYGPWTISHQSFSEKLGPDVEGIRTSVTFVENELSSSSLEFASNYRKVNQANRIPSPVAAAQTYDALRLLTLAIYQANSVEGAKIQAALENLKVRTTSTIVSRYARPFTPTDHEAVSLNMIIMGEYRNGRVVYAYKEDASRGLIARTKK